jgi:PAS domain S-box-containing protein
MNDISVLETVIENVPVGVMITDHEGVILTINQRHEEISGISRQELIGQNIRSMTGKGFLKESVTEKVLQTGKPFIYGTTSLGQNLSI